MPDGRLSNQAGVRIAADERQAAFGTDHVVVRHHRTPQVAWSIDVASGGHVLHLALAQCVFNNVLRIAKERGVAVGDLLVTADGDFNADGTASTGIDCAIELSGAADQASLTAIAQGGFDDSSVAAILRHGCPVELRSVRATPDPRQERQQR
jgi:hypothetical protein